MVFALQEDQLQQQKHGDKMPDKSAEGKFNQVRVNDSNKNPPIDPDSIKILLNKASWQEVLSLLETADTTLLTSAFKLNSKAKALASLGFLNDAAILCEQSLSFEATNKETYFIYALILIELDRLAEAETALKRTIFLDRSFVEAHFQLGLLLIKDQKKTAGLKSLHNALEIAKSNDPSCIVEGSDNLNYKRFAEILKNEIEFVAGRTK